MATEEMATKARGNTKARAYQLTLNEPKRLQELLQNMKKYKSLTYYMVSALERGEETQHEHYHVYLHFKTPIKLSIKNCCGAHVEHCKGTFQDNLKYCTKQGPLTEEWGERPHQGLKTVEELREMDANDVPPQYYKIKKQIDEEEKAKNSFMNMLEEIENDELKAPEIIYITGGSGKGKTYTAYKTALKHYKKNEIGKLTIHNNFIDVINEDAKCYVIEEFRPSQMSASCFLQLTDKYGYRANTKGSFVSLRPEMIIICCILPPNKIYREELNKQFQRRITKIINMDDDDDDDSNVEI